MASKWVGYRHWCPTPKKYLCSPRLALCAAAGRGQKRPRDPPLHRALPRPATVSRRHHSFLADRPRATTWTTFARDRHTVVAFFAACVCRQRPDAFLGEASLGDLLDFAGVAEPTQRLETITRAGSMCGRQVHGQRRVSWATHTPGGTPLKDLDANGGVRPSPGRQTCADARSFENY